MSDAVADMGMYIVIDDSNTILHRSRNTESKDHAIARARESEHYDPSYGMVIPRIHGWSRVSEGEVS